MKRFSPFSRKVSETLNIEPFFTEATCSDALSYLCASFPIVTNRNKVDSSQQTTETHYYKLK